MSETCVRCEARRVRRGVSTSPEPGRVNNAPPGLHNPAECCCLATGNIQQATDRHTRSSRSGGGGGGEEES